mgnify:FL=1
MVQLSSKRAKRRAKVLLEWVADSCWSCHCPSADCAALADVQARQEAQRSVDNSNESNWARELRGMITFLLASVVDRALEVLASQDKTLA